ncbi:MAG: hypothetical protein HYV62_04695 [Candidatus Rokubacteria bacterium]|nr:hypothetical protein [Candidatus Rokubacteria bacterium]
MTPPTPSHAQGPGRLRVAIAAALLLGAGCAGPSLVLPVHLERDVLRAAADAAPPADYASAVRAISAVMVEELGLPLPGEFTLYVYPTRGAYARGLAAAGDLPAERAADIARHSAGLGQARRLFINDGALRDVPRKVWLGVLAHELTHVAQYALSGGRRGRSEQWLREGMADWVACRVVERLGAGRFREERDRAVRAVARGFGRLGDGPLDLVELGRPHGWEARHRRAGGKLTYRLVFLLTDELVRRHGFERLLTYLRAFADADDRFGNFRRAFGVSVEAFEAEALGRLREELGRQAASPS